MLKQFSGSFQASDLERAAQVPRIEVTEFVYQAARFLRGGGARLRRATRERCQARLAVRLAERRAPR